MPLLIDGYNLLRWVQRYDEVCEGLDEAGLCRVISQYVQPLRERADVYFDGLGPPDKTDLGGLAGVEVYFTGPDWSADDIIEERIDEDTAPRRLVVVSTDRRLRAAAGHRKARSLTCEVFWGEVQRVLRRRRPVAEPREKRAGIGWAETDLWLDEFGIE